MDCIPSLNIKPSYTAEKTKKCEMCQGSGYIHPKDATACLSDPLCREARICVICDGLGAVDPHYICFKCQKYYAKWPSKYCGGCNP